MLRVLFSARIVGDRSRRSSFLGFILPTTTLLLLVVSLAVGAISLRTLNRTEQTIGQRQQQVIYNAATPVLDRAKAKIGHLMAGRQGHPRSSTGVPPENDLVRMMLNEPGSPFRHDAKDVNGNPINTSNDIYTFDGTGAFSRETRLDIGTIDNVARGDNLDNAWEFEADTDGDGIKDAYVVYSIIFNTPDNDPNNDVIQDIGDAALAGRAAKLEVRHGPQSLIASSDRCPAVQQVGIEDGWFSDEVNTAFLRKNFQVDAVVIPGVVDDAGNLIGPDQKATVVTLEFHQDRTFDRGNKWGAWFRNDIEVFPGPAFRWNGAMHSEGSVIIGRPNFSSYLISSEFSCFNVPGASEISAGNDGQIVFGQVDGGDIPESGSRIDIYKDYGVAPDDTQRLTVDTDSVDIGGGDDMAIAKNLSNELLLDPVKLLVDDVSELREDDNVDVTFSTPDEWKAAQPILSDRIVIGERELLSDKLDDIYRDGHWEDLAASTGTRIVVGQRLDLGIPLDPWDNCGENPNNIVAPGRCHEARQRRTLSDKLAAVQATAVYGAGAAEPMACLATTVHPGTSETLKRAATFRDFNGDLGGILTGSGGSLFAIEDFFTGRGTNGWEFEPPSVASSGVMDIALQNLANFAGDPRAGAPYFPPVQDNVVHPYPYMAMVGDFSMLRRTLGTASTPAVESYKDTASCLLGMLAHNITYLQKFEDYLTFPGNPALGGVPGQVGARINQILTNPASVHPAVDATRFITAPPPPDELAEALVEALERWNGAEPATVTDEMVTTARMVMTMTQVKRDRQFGYDNGSSCAPALTTLNLDDLCSNTPKYPILFSIFPTTSHFEGPNGTQVRGVDLITNTDPGGSQYLLESDVNATVEYQALTDANIEAIALAPKQMSAWTLPHASASGVAGSAPNSPDDVLIKCDNFTCDGGRDVEVAFKDAAIMDGRQLMSVRVLDLNMDLFKTMMPTGNSAIIYAFREDAVREDSIVRPHAAGATAANCTTDHAAVLNAGCMMNAGQDPAGATFVDAFNSTDPPLAVDSNGNDVSIKPVDYFPDPDRRAHGFRLRNGEQLNRSTTANVDESISFISDNPVYIMGDFNLHQRGDGTRLEEFKNGDLLDEDYGNFYGRGEVVNNVDTEFGLSNTDLWRPTEILSDAVTILSNNFCDGSIRDVFDVHSINGPRLTGVDTKYGCAADSFTSYTNFPYPNQTQIPLATGDWTLENEYDPGSPISITENGNPMVGGVAYDGQYKDLTTTRLAHIIEPGETTVNAVLFSAAVPSRFNLSYGGLHNFPRFLENWSLANDTTDDDVELSISGAFFQLGFSKYATAPYDQEIWEPTAADATESRLIHQYYRPPLRQWGYDVALQKNAPAQIAKEFTSNSPLVSEFYSEPPLDDPYIAQLCRQVNGAVCPN